MTWKQALQTTRGRWALAFCLFAALIIAVYEPIFYRDIISPKKGRLIDDPFLNLLTPIDWSLPTFIILYLAVIQTLATAVKKPGMVITGLTVYCAVSLFRMITMYVVALEPPSGMILLADPISSILYPDGGFAKDLFFSGHVSTMVILVLLEKKKIAKTLKITGTIMMGVFLAWQHVHYTIDLLAAPIVTYWIFSLIEKSIGLPEVGQQSN